MLFAKDLKVALAAVIAAVGLLGFNVAHATVYIDADADADEYTRVVNFASEEWDGGEATATTTNSFDVRVKSIDALLEPGKSYYLRFQLMGGMTFAKDPAEPTIDGTYLDGSTTFGVTGGTPATAVTQRASQGEEDDTYGIWRFSVRPDGVSTGGTINEGVGAESWNVLFSLGVDSINLPTGSGIDGETCYEIELSVWDDFGDARENQQAAAASEALIRKSTDLACLVPVVSAALSMPQELTASVDSDFRRFLGDATSGTLATLTVTVLKEREVTEGDNEVTLPILNPADGEAITAADVLGSGVEFTVEGDFSLSGAFGFGEFKLGTADLDRYGGGPPGDDDAEALAEAVAASADGIQNLTTFVQGSVTTEGAHAFTVNVAGNAGDENPYSQIGVGQYSADWEIAANGIEGMAANAGSIKRDGTTVRIGYLTTAVSFAPAREDADGDPLYLGDDGSSYLGTSGYNQRLVITNHGAIAARVTLGSFVAEEVDGAASTVTVLDQEHDDATDDVWVTEVPAETQLVTPVAQIISISPRSRAAAIFTAAAKEDLVSVFTTQVTLPEGQTDTVRYWPLQ